MREINNLTLGQVAQYEGKSKGYLSNLENGINQPSVWPLLASLAKRYRTSADYLLRLTDDPAPYEERKMPEYGADIVEMLRRLPANKRREIYRIVSVIAEENEKSEERQDRQFAQALDLLEHKLTEDDILELFSTVLGEELSESRTATRLRDAIAFASGRLEGTKSESSDDKVQKI